jgi:hypothetical protein
MYPYLLAASDPVGILGVFLILVAYYLLSTGRLGADTMRFQVVNFIGSWLILYSLLFHWNTASVVIEIFWILISIMGMLRIKGLIRKKRLSDLSSRQLELK